MLLVSAPSDALRDALVGHGAIAHSSIPDWEPSAELIAVVVGAGPASVHLALGIDCEVEDIETLWFERIRPFEANLRTGRRAPRHQQPILAQPDSRWPAHAARLIARLRKSTDSSVHHIDHIGSTSVSGLLAKDLIDIQVVVDDLRVASKLARDARRAGFVQVKGELYGEDREGVKFREEVAVNADPGRPVNVNIRSFTDPVWKETLLFRNFLRANSVERDSYAEMKRSLVTQGLDIDRYGEFKMPYIRSALKRAGALLL